MSYNRLKPIDAIRFGARHGAMRDEVCLTDFFQLKSMHSGWHEFYMVGFL